MDANEFKAWSNYMKSRRGTWTIDPIHDGKHRDLIAFISDRNDHSKGVYVHAAGSTIEAGRYEEGDVHMGDAVFQPLWGVTMLDDPELDKTARWGVAKPTNAAMKLMIERLGVAFLLGALCDVPGR